MSLINCTIFLSRLQPWEEEGKERGSILRIKQDIKLFTLLNKLNLIKIVEH